MNSEREFSLNFSLNKSGASKASAQLKAILSVLVFILASAFFMYGIYAAEFASTDTAPAWTGAACGSMDFTGSESYSTLNFTVQASGDNIMTLDFQINDTLLDNYTIQNVISEPTNLSCSVLTTADVACNNNTVTGVYPGNDMIISLNMSSNRSGICSSSALYNFNWTVDTEDNSSATNTTYITTQYDATTPSLTTVIITSAYHDAGTMFYVKESYSITSGTTETGSGISACDYTTNTSDMPPSWSAATYASSNCTKTGITIADGVVHETTFRVTDDAGNAGSGDSSHTLNVTGDSTGPTLSAVTPSGDSTTSDTSVWFNATGISDAGAGVLSLCEFIVTIDGANVSAVYVAPTGDYCEYQKTGLSDENDVSAYIRVNDTLNNFGAHSITNIYSIDTTGPAITWNSPAADSIVSGNVTLDATFEDDSNVAPGAIEFISHCGGTIHFDYNTNCNETSPAGVIKCNATWDTTAAARGDCNITAYGEDNVDSGTVNQNSANRSFGVAHQCGDVVSNSVTLTANLSTCDAIGITLDADNIFLDCAGFSIVGDNDANENYGVKISAFRTNVTVKNCNIYGYGNPGALDAGIMIYHSGDNITIFNNTIYSPSIGIHRNILTDYDNYANVTGNTILDTTYGAGISFNNANMTTIENNIIRNTTGNGIEITMHGIGVGIAGNTINATGGNGIYLNNTNGFIELNTITYSVDDGIYLFESGMVINNNTITDGVADGIEIYANGPVSNITNNTIVANGDNGIAISSSMPIYVWHNNLFDNDFMQVNSGDVVILSVDNSGNYWGHSTCPTFISGTDASSSITVDSYAYNTTWGWLTYPEPPMCCGFVATSSTTLSSDLTNCDATGITIEASDVILDCAGHAIAGDYSTADTIGVEILTGYNNITIKNCTIYGFSNDGFGIYGDSLGSDDGDINVIFNTLYDNGYAISLTADSAGSNNYGITDNVILNTTNGYGMYIESSANVYVDLNYVYDTADIGIDVESSTGTISNNTVNGTVGYGINIYDVEGTVDSNNVSFGQSEGVYIDNTNALDVTNNNIFNNSNVGLFIDDHYGTGTVLVFHNNVYNNNDGIGNNQVYTMNNIELSNGSEGNWWGRTSCPVFVPETDSNDAAVIDSHAYNETNGWLLHEPTYCITLDSFTDSDLNTAISFNYDDCYTSGPCSINFWVNITNSSAAEVNLTHGGICMGGTDPQPMSYLDDGYTDFYYGCVINSGTLESMGSPFNVTAAAYLDAAPGYADEENYTISFDFEIPAVNFTWWSTVDSSGDPISLVSPESMFDSQDIFFSPADNWVNIKINVTDNTNVEYVEANFSKLDSAMAVTGGNCSGIVNLTDVGGDYWEYNCSLGDYNKSVIQDDLNGGSSSPVYEGEADVQITAYDSFGNPTAATYNTSESTPTPCEGYTDECMPIVTPILIHDIGVMGSTTYDEINESCEDFGPCDAEDYCFLFGPATTNFSNEANFSDIDFTVEMKVNISCLGDAGLIANDMELPDSFETMMILNLSSLDMNSQETAAKLARLPDNIEVQINAPGDFGQSYIYINSTAFTELDTDATIRFFHLPFASAPDVEADFGAAGVSGSAVWVSGADDFWDGKIAGNLTFNVLGFSGYNISDTTAPTVVIDYPAASANLSTNYTVLNMTLNGTGTQISSVLVYDSASLVYNYSEDASQCYNISEGSDEWLCNISLTELSDGTHPLTVYVYDYGAESPGNNASATRTFTTDTTAPNITITTPESDEVLNAAMLPYNITGTAADGGVGIADTTWYIDGAGQGSVDMSPLPLWWTNWNPSDGTYNITAQSCDNAGNCANATEATRIVVDATEPLIDITYPADSDVLTSSTVTINVTTTETNPSQLKLYVDGTLVNTTAYSDSTAVTTFTASIAEGTHEIGAIASDLAGNANTTTNITIEIDTTAPAASGIETASITNESLTIGAGTDEDASCKVEYGTTTAVGTNATMSGIGPTSSSGKYRPSVAYYTVHTADITGLDAGTKYYYKITCADEHGNSGSSATDTFTTANYNTQEIDNTTTTNMTFNFTENGTTSRGAEIELSLNETINATVRVLRSNSSTNANFSLGGYTGLSMYYTIESSEINSTNIEWAYIKIYYNDSDLPANFDESSLKLYWYNTTSSAWEVITPSGVDTTNNYVWGNSTHFSEYTSAGTITTAEGGEGSTTNGGSSGSAPGNGTSQTVNLDSLVTYTAENIAVRDKVLFTLNGEQHTLELVSMSTESIVVDISSATERVTIVLGQTKAVDINADGINDMQIKLTDISLGKADIILTKIASTGAAAEPQEITEETAPAQTQEPGIVEAISEKAEAAGFDMSIVIAVIIAILIAAGAIIAYKYAVSKK